MIRVRNWEKKKKLNSLIKNMTWHLVPSPAHGKVIGCKWVYKLKLKADGSIDRYKACLVAKGYHQTAGLDFFKTFSSVVKPITIRVVLTLAISQNWPIWQLDIQNEFLHGDLTEEVFIMQPLGFFTSNSPTMCVNWRKHSTVSNNLLVPGSPN